MKKMFIFVLFSLILSGSVRSQINGSFNFDGINRTWIVYLPVDYSQGESIPLLLALHGYTQNGQEMMQFSGFNSIADTGNFVVVYPDGVANSWNVGFSGGSTADDVGFLSALIDTLHQRYNIDLNRVYSTGFSNGGFMSYRLACELGNRIAAIAPVSGTMTDVAGSSCTPQREMPVLHIHGTNDFVVSYNGGFGNQSVDQVLEFWNNYNECPATPVIVNLPDIVAEGSTVQRYSWAPCTDSAEVILLKVINGGHTWPGSVGTTGIGITNRDIVASSEIWNFVKRFSLNNATGVTNPASEPLKIFPNPSPAGTLLIETPELQTGAILKISGIDGKTVLTQQFSPGFDRLSVDVSGLSPGIYLVRLYGFNSTMIAKLVIQPE